jgi:hypothetical protein
MASPTIENAKSGQATMPHASNQLNSFMHFFGGSKLSGSNQPFGKTADKASQ